MPRNKIVEMEKIGESMIEKILFLQTQVLKCCNKQDVPLNKKVNRTCRRRMMLQVWIFNDNKKTVASAFFKILHCTLNLNIKN